MLLDFPNGVGGEASIAKVEVVSVLSVASVLLPYSCSALHSYTRKQISLPAPNGDCGAALRGRFSLELASIQSGLATAMGQGAVLAVYSATLPSSQRLSLERP